MNGHGPPESINGEDVPDNRSGPSATLRQNAVVESVAEGTGRLKHVILDTSTREVTGIVVAYSGKEWLVPIYEVTRVTNDWVRLRGPWSDYLSGESFDRRDFRPVAPRVAQQEGMRRAIPGAAPL